MMVLITSDVRMRSAVAANVDRMHGVGGAEAGAHTNMTCSVSYECPVRLDFNIPRSLEDVAL